MTPYQKYIKDQFNEYFNQQDGNVDIVFFVQAMALALAKESWVAGFQGRWDTDAPHSFEEFLKSKGIIQYVSISD